MIEPVKMADFFVTFFSAASVVAFGALYALLFAYSRIKNVPRLMPLVYAAYAALFAAVITLATVANLFGGLFWVVVVMLMLAGYLVAPHAIWHLCVSTHAAAPYDRSSVDGGVQSSVSLDRSNPENLHQPCKEKTS